MPLISSRTVAPVVRCSPLLALRHLKQRFLKVTPFTRSFKFAHHPGFDIAPVTDPTLRKRSAGIIESLAVPLRRLWRAEEIPGTLALPDLLARFPGFPVCPLR